MGGIYNLPRLVGISKACELAFLGHIIDAQTAERIGLINRVVPADELETVANEWAAKIAQSSSLAISLLKSALYKGLNMDFISEIDNEINIQTLCLNSHNGKEGLRAFMEKRQPVFNLLDE
jgi:enoyl-CoA hydratase/carnithine racemase